MPQHMFDTHAIYVDREGDGSGQLSDILATTLGSNMSSSASSLQGLTNNQICRSRTNLFLGTSSTRFYHFFSERCAIHNNHTNSIVHCTIHLCILDLGATKALKKT